MVVIVIIRNGSVKIPVGNKNKIEVHNTTQATTLATGTQWTHSHKSNGSVLSPPATAAHVV